MTADTPTILIRAMRPEELQDLCKRTAEIDPWKTLNLNADWLLKDLTEDEGVEFHVAEVRNGDSEPEVAGWVSHCPQGAAEDFQYKGIEAQIRDLAGPAEGSYVRDIAVFPGWQGLGLGKKLMAIVEERTRAFGLSRVFLSVSSFNVQAKKFYKLQGFRDVLNRPGLIHPDHSETIMVKELGPR